MPEKPNMTVVLHVDSTPQTPSYSVLDAPSTVLDGDLLSFKMDSHGFVTVLTRRPEYLLEVALQALSAVSDVTKAGENLSAVGSAALAEIDQVVEELLAGSDEE